MTARRLIDGSTRAAVVFATTLLLGAFATTASADYNVFTQVSLGEINGNGGVDSIFNGISADGSHVFFDTPERLTTADVDNSLDVYKRVEGQTYLVSTGRQELLADFLHASADGTRVLLRTREALLSEDVDGVYDIYQRSGTVVTRISRGAVAGNGDYDVRFDDASADGSRVFFRTPERLTTDDLDSQWDLYERSGGSTKLVSAPAVNGSVPYDANLFGMSTDGTRVFFETRERLVSTDTDAENDVYERSAGTTKLVSTGQVNGNGPHVARFRGATPDGKHVFFYTTEALTTGDTDSVLDVYDRAGGTTTRISKGEANDGGPHDADYKGVSADGTRVFFETIERLTSDDTDSHRDVFERSAGTTTRISKGTAGGNGPFSSWFSGASVDGTRVVFGTAEPMGSADLDNQVDIYQRSAGTTARVTKGAVNGNGAYATYKVGTAADGTRVFFQTAEQLTSDDSDTVTDVYEWSDGTTTRVSRGLKGGNGAVSAYFAAATASGSRVFFFTREKLSCSDTDDATDIYSASFALQPQPESCVGPVVNGPAS